jgi:hypothetical protein
MPSQGLNLEEINMVTEIKQFPRTRPIDNEVESLGNLIPLENIKPKLALKMPNDILLGSLRDGRLKVISPINVKFSLEGDQTIAESPELNEFGFGENWFEALADLQRAISELYFTLEKEHKKLGIDLQNVWQVLQKKILKR